MIKRQKLIINVTENTKRTIPSLLSFIYEPIHKNVCHGRCQMRFHCPTSKLFVKFSFTLKSSMVASPVKKFTKLFMP